MGGVLGVGTTGIQAGGLVASAQTAAMSGGSVGLVLAPVVVPFAVTALATGAAVGYGVAKVLAPATTFRVPPNGARGTYVVSAHDWGEVRFWSFEDVQEASSLCDELAPLRTILVDTTRQSSVYGSAVPWTEVKHFGENPAVDNEIRAALRNAI